MINEFWLIGDIQVVGSLIEAPSAAAQSSKRLPRKPVSTKAERTAKLKSAFDPVCRIAAKTVGATEKVIGELGNLLQGLNVTLPSAVARKSASSTTSLEIVANPKVERNQNQKRTEPKNSGAPTTKTSKEASRKSTRERKKTEKAKAAMAAGRDSSGKRTWGNKKQNGIRTIG